MLVPKGRSFVEKRHRSVSEDLSSRLEEHLAQTFRDAGWVVSRSEPRGVCDFVVSNGATQYAIELKVAKEARRTLLQALFADSLLRARWSAQQLDNAKPLAVVGAPSISDALADDLQAYASKYGGNDAFGFIDAEGRLELFGSGLEHLHTEKTSQRMRGARRHARSFDAFSDLNQWMLKILLAKRLPQDLLSAPRSAIYNANRLKEVANVSAPSAFRFVTYLRSEGFLAAHGKSLELQHVDELLRRWSAAARRTLPFDQPMRWIFQPRDPMQKLDEALSSYQARTTGTQAPRVCLGLFIAADRLGFPFVRGVTPCIYAEQSFSGTLEDLGLFPVEPGEKADVFVRFVNRGESIFRAAVLRGGVAVCDIIQCWLDVSGHPARGEEQADYLFRKVIRPRVIEGAL